MKTEKGKKQAEKEEVIQLSGYYLGEALCGVDISLVQEINDDLTITKVPLAPEYVLGIMNLRGQIVTVIDQSRKLGFEPSEIGPQSKIIIVKSQSEHIGLLVDRITEVITARKKDIVETPPNIKDVQGKYFRGVIHTASHELLAVLNVEAVLADE